LRKKRVVVEVRGLAKLVTFGPGEHMKRKEKG